LRTPFKGKRGAKSAKMGAWGRNPSKEGKPRAPIKTLGCLPREKTPLIGRGESEKPPRRGR